MKTDLKAKNGIKKVPPKRTRACTWTEPREVSGDVNHHEGQLLTYTSSSSLASRLEQKLLRTRADYFYWNFSMGLPSQFARRSSLQSNDYAKLIEPSKARALKGVAFYKNTRQMTSRRQDNSIMWKMVIKTYPHSTIVVSVVHDKSSNHKESEAWTEWMMKAHQESERMRERQIFMQTGITLMPRKQTKQCITTKPLEVSGDVNHHRSQLLTYTMSSSLAST